MFDQNLDDNSDDLFSAVQNLPEIRLSGLEVSGRRDSVSEVVSFIKEVPGRAKVCPSLVHDEFGSNLIQLGVRYGSKASMGQIPALAGKSLSHIGEDFPLTVGLGIDNQMDVVRGGSMWQLTNNRNAQRIRFDTLDIILEALKSAAGNGKDGKRMVPAWVDPKLAEYVTEMIVWPHYTDRPMIEFCLGLMEDTIYTLPKGIEKIVKGNVAEEVAEKTTSKACDTLEALLYLAPNLAEASRGAVRKIDTDIQSDEYFLDRRIDSVGVVALELADVTITKATSLSPADAKRRLMNMPRKKASLVI